MFDNYFKSNEDHEINEDDQVDVNMIIGNPKVVSSVQEQTIKSLLGQIIEFSELEYGFLKNYYDLKVRVFEISKIFKWFNKIITAKILSQTDGNFHRILHQSMHNTLLNVEN